MPCSGTLRLIFPVPPTFCQLLRTQLRSEVLSEAFYFFFSSRRRHTRFDCDWSSDVCSSDLGAVVVLRRQAEAVEDLNLVALLQVDAAVAAVLAARRRPERQAKLDVQLEVPDRKSVV